MTNVLEALVNISSLDLLTINKNSPSNNRIISVGEGLEDFVKNSFANSFDIVDQNYRQLKYELFFSYMGSKRSPPDLMLINGDAFEIKKIESLSTELQLNSSHPKSKIYADSKLINLKCKNCEEWIVKDFLYIIGHVPNNTNILSSLWFIDGGIYAADDQVYSDIKDSVSKLLRTTPTLDFKTTNEIGRLNALDPLKISNLRIRGMWLLQQPFKAFSNVHEYSNQSKFQAIAILSAQKYMNYPQVSRTKVEHNSKISVKDIKVKNPNNPSDLIEAKLISYKLD